jgi:hypothetical protein
MLKYISVKNIWKSDFLFYPLSFGTWRIFSFKKNTVLKNAGQGQVSILTRKNCHTQV